jgi:hypothetical protein
MDNLLFFVSTTVAEERRNHYILVTIGFDRLKFNYYSRNVEMYAEGSGLRIIYSVLGI